MSIVLFDNDERDKLYPLNSVCAVADIRAGIFTMRERWQHILKEEVYVHTTDYLSILYKPFPSATNVWIDANLVPDERIIHLIFSLKENEAFADERGLVAGKKNFPDKTFSPSVALKGFTTVHKLNHVKRFEYPWQLFQWNNEILCQDFERITAGKSSKSLPSNSQYVDAANIFIEEGASVNFSIINAATGPVYIGKNCTIMEGCTIRGPLALCEGAVLKMGAKIYGAVTLGRFCMGGGEIKNVVMQDYSNKAHDGYLGDSVIGKWCNLGAGTSNSNVKNTAGHVKMWNHFRREYTEVGNKCGVIMGDYSKTAINCSINTGTVIGVCCNVFDEGLLPKYISDFQWGAKGIIKYEFEKAIQDIANWKRLKDKELTETEIKVLKHIFKHSFDH